MGLGLAIALAALQARTPSPYQPSPSQNDHPSKKARRGLDWVACFTGLLAFVAALQLWEFVQSERASLTITEVDILSQSNSPLRLAATVTNGGKSTTTEGTFYATGRLGELPPVPDYSGVSPGGLPPIIAGGKTTEFADLPLTDEQIANLYAGKVQLSVFGYITYRDVFSLYGYKTLGFCLVHRGPAGKDAFPFGTCKSPRYTYLR